MKKSTKKTGAKKSTTKKATTKKAGTKKSTTKKASAKKGGLTPQQKKIGMMGKTYNEAFINAIAGRKVSYVEKEKAKIVARKAVAKIK